MNTELNIWKYTWNDLLSDTEFRKYMVAPKRSSVIDVINGKVHMPNILHNQGTIYIDDVKLGHFLSYEIIGENFIIHDPADVNTFEGYLNNTVLKKLKEKLKNYKVESSNVKPQKCNWDTFCQTWSLAKLMGFELDHVTKNTSRRELFKIIKEIAASKDFEEYVKFNKAWIENSIKSHGKSKDFKTAQDFINYSRRLSFKKFQAFR